MSKRAHTRVRSETLAVAEAIRIAADRGSRIISLAIGSLSVYQSIREAIQYAVGPDNSVLVVAAAGTWWGSSGPPICYAFVFNLFSSCPTWLSNPTSVVVFPASMDEVVAVTAVQLDNWVPANVTRNPKVEFAMMGDLPSVAPSLGGPPVSTPVRFSGSSAAVSAFAGAAALVWSRYPSISRDSLLQILRCSHDWYPRCQRWSNEIGYGAPDVLRALGGISSVATASAPDPDHPGCWLLSVTNVAGGVGPFTYHWPQTGSNGPTTQLCTSSEGVETAYQAYTEVHVAEPDGATRRGKAWYWVYPP